MERLWKKILQRRVEQSGSDACIIFVPEYGYDSL